MIIHKDIRHQNRHSTVTSEIAEATGSRAPRRKHERDHTKMFLQYLDISLGHVDPCSSSPDRSPQQKQNVLLRGQ